MKRFFCFFACLSLMTVTKAQRVIENPALESGSDYLSIYKVELSDAATVLRGDVYNLPGEGVSVSSNAAIEGRVTGKTYKLLRMEGLAPDKETLIPASGNVPVSLFFEPVDRRDTIADLAWGDDETIAGLRLTAPDHGGKIHCRIAGTVEGRPDCSRLMLVPAFSDFRFEPWVPIPVRDGKFAYDLYTDFVEAYQLIPWIDVMARGGWDACTFFAEQGDVDITFHPYGKIPRVDIRAQAPVNAGYRRYTDNSTRLWNSLGIAAIEDKLRALGAFSPISDSVLTAPARELRKRVDALEMDDPMRLHLWKRQDSLSASGNMYIPEVQSLFDRKKVLDERWLAGNKVARLAYLRGNQTAASLYVLCREVVARNILPDDLELYAGIYDSLYAAKFSGHTYAQRIDRVLENALSTRIGARFVDFTAPDLAGREHRLSDEIRGKVAIIDLWASWCGGCRMLSKTIIPIYNKYKDRGFTVVGVAREFNSTEDIKKAVARDRYPWLNLVELDNSGQIWRKYGVEYTTGLIVMVDASGRIMAIDPTADEINSHLKRLLGPG